MSALTATTVPRPSLASHNTRYASGLPTRCLKMVCLNPHLLLDLMERTITLSGIPPDARYVRSYQDRQTEEFCVIFEHPSFPAHPEGAPVYPEGLTITEHVEAPHG